MPPKKTDAPMITLILLPEGRVKPQIINPSERPIVKSRHPVSESIKLGNDSMKKSAPRTFIIKVTLDDDGYQGGRESNENRRAIGNMADVILVMA